MVLIIAYFMLLYFCHLNNNGTFQVGKHGPNTLGAFHQKHFTSERACLFAVGGVEHNHLVKIAEALDLGKGAGKKNITFNILILCKN